VFASGEKNKRTNLRRIVDLSFLRALQRESSRNPRIAGEKRHQRGLSSWTVKRRLWPLEVAQLSLHNVSHREDSVDVAMSDD
jgi:hypothetical protein